MTNPTLERAARAAGETAADMENDVKHLLSKAAIERVVCAVLMAVLDLPDETERRAMEILSEMGAAYYPRHIGDYHHAMIDAILGENDDNA